MATTPPYVGPVDVGDDFFSVGELRNTKAIEIATSADAATWVAMAALMPDHYDALHTETARAMPVYFSRRPNGLRLHPAADKAYWIRVTYRAPIGTKAPTAAV